MNDTLKDLENERTRIGDFSTAKKEDIERLRQHLLDAMPPDMREQSEKRFSDIDRQFNYEVPQSIKKRLRKKEYNPVVAFFARAFDNLLSAVITIYQIAGLANIYFVYEIYKVCKKTGLIGIFHTKWTLFIVVYVIVLFLLRELSFSVFKYASKTSKK
jgi:hypothetical protein